MTSPLPATVVNALIEPLVEVIHSRLGLSVNATNLGLTRQLDPPPEISVTVELRGKLYGPITWVFPETIARQWAGRMLAIEETHRIDSETFREAVAELANIASGNAAGSLLAAGYQIEILPPRVHDDEVTPHFVAGRLFVKLATSAGPMKIVFGLQEAPR